MTGTLQWLLVAWSLGLKESFCVSRLLGLLLVCMVLTWMESLRLAVALSRRAPPWHLLRLPEPSWSLQFHNVERRIRV